MDYRFEAENIEKQDIIEVIERGLWHLEACIETYMPPEEKNISNSNFCMAGTTLNGILGVLKPLEKYIYKNKDYAEIYNLAVSLYRSMEQKRNT